MPIQFSCATCGNPFNAPDHMAGTQARCNGCGAIVNVPGLVPIPSETPGLRPFPAQPFPAQPFPAQPLPAKPMVPRRIIKPGPPPSQGAPALAVWLVVGGVSVVLLVVAVAVVFSLLMSRSEQTVADGPHESVTLPSSAAPAGAPPASSPSPSASSSTTRPTYEVRPSRTSPSTTSSSTTSPNTTTTVTLGTSPAEPSADPPPARATGVELGTPSKQPATISPNRNGATPAAADWDGGSEDGQVRIPVDRARVTFGPSGCPIVVVGNRVWDLNQGKLVQELEGEYQRHGIVHTALSASGKWFAATVNIDTDGEVFGIWNTTTGEQTATADPGEKSFVELITFSLDKYLIVRGRMTNRLQVWDAATGSVMKPIDTPGDRFDQGKIAFTSDAQYFASVADKRLVVVKTSTKKTAAVMASPKAIERSPTGQSVISRNNQVVADNRRATAIDSVFIFSSLQAMAFSPDSQELAAVSTSPRPRLMCWSNRGKLMYDEPLDQLPRITSWEHSIQWLPDRSGWLVSGNVIDRQSKRIVFGVRKKFGHDLNVYALDKERLLGAFPHNPDELEVMIVPWEQIRESLKLLDAKAPALLSPSQPVSANVELAGLRGDQTETTQVIGQALEQRLARDGMRIEPGQKTYFQLRFSEEAGDQLPIYERQSPFDFRGHDTGRTATEAKGALIVELISGEETLWRDSLSASSSSSFRDEINDSTVRKSMLANLARQIAELNFPYFIPASKDQLALPVVIE